MGRMEGKVVLITGGARGQGRSHAVTLAREGADILTIDCPGDVGALPYALGTPQDLAETVAQVEALDRRIIAVEGDVRREADLDELVNRGLEEFGKIDVCVANAGVGAPGDFWETSDELWDATIGVNLFGIWKTVQAVAPHMIERESGSIILISSVAGIDGAPGLAAYSASKFGVLGLLQAFCNELGPKYGIRCNAVLPGAVDTDIIKFPAMLDYMAGGEGLGQSIDLNEAVKSYHGLKGVGMLDPQETSNAVLFLASDESRRISGLQMTVDAGHAVLPRLNMEPDLANSAD